MKVRYLGSTSSACDMYRASIPFASLLDKGYDVEFLGPDMEQALVNGDDYEFEADVLIVPRPLSQFQYNVLVAANAAGIATVVELDDEMDSVHPDNTAYGSIFKGIPWLYKSIEECDLLTVSTRRLQERYAPDKAVVVPNCVPDQAFEIELSEQKWGIGWTGSIDVHPADLQVVGTALRKMRQRHEVEFRHVGHGNVSNIIKCNYVSYGFLEFGEYFHTINTFAVGIVPLERSSFNDSKSYLKGIEYAAMGVPFVASPVAEYEYLHKAYGIGLLASSEYEWYVNIRKLLRSNDALNEMQQEYRQIAYDTFRMSINDWRWVEAWDEALKRKQ